METLTSCFLLGICVLSVQYGCDADHGPRVTVPQGVIEGKTVIQSGVIYDSFQGIPYAKPPIGKRRFKNPKPAKPWQGILNATQVGSACPQYDRLFLDKYYGEEDCLFLNIYMPKHDCDEHLPVLLNIHGGGFLVGDGSPLLYGPQYYVKAGIILVTLNFRLGALGFLSLNTPGIPGNAGLKDQVLALKWVKKNIAKFGGDDSKITIQGQGSGGASVMYHILSPLSKGLFNNAISQAGSALAPWALQKQPESNAQKLAQILGIGNSTDIAAFLKKIPVKDIVLAAQSPVFDDQVKLTFVPTIEKIQHYNRHHSYNKPFITSSPIHILKSGKINKMNVILGLTTNDGVLYLTKQFLSPSNREAILNDCLPDMRQFIPDEILTKCGANETVEIETKILKKYFPESENITDGLINLYNDVAFVQNHIMSVQLLAKYSGSVWLFKYQYKGQKDITKLTSGLDYPGAGYNDFLAYIFDVQFDGINQINASAVDILTGQQIMEMSKNFILYGNPTPVRTPLMDIIWKPVSENYITGIDFSSTSTIISLPYADVLKFWGDLDKICYNNETTTPSFEVITEPGNCIQEKKCNGGSCKHGKGGEGNNGCLHKIYHNMFSGNSEGKNDDKRNIILHYLIGQISRFLK